MKTRIYAAPAVKVLKELQLRPYYGELIGEERGGGGKGLGRDKGGEMD